MNELISPPTGRFPAFAMRLILACEFLAHGCFRHRLEGVAQGIGAAIRTLD